MDKLNKFTVEEIQARGEHFYRDELKAHTAAQCFWQALVLGEYKAPLYLFKFFIKTMNINSKDLNYLTALMYGISLKLMPNECSNIVDDAIPIIDSQTQQQIDILINLIEESKQKFSTSEVNIDILINQINLFQHTMNLPSGKAIESYFDIKYITDQGKEVILKVDCPIDMYQEAKILLNSLIRMPDLEHDRIKFTKKFTKGLATKASICGVIDAVPLLVYLCDQEIDYNTGKFWIRVGKELGEPICSDFANNINHEKYNIDLLHFETDPTNKMDKKIIVQACIIAEHIQSNARKYMNTLITEKLWNEIKNIFKKLNSEKIISFKEQLYNIETDNYIYEYSSVDEVYVACTGQACVIC